MRALTPAAQARMKVTLKQALSFVLPPPVNGSCKPHLKNRKLFRSSRREFDLSADSLTRFTL